MAGDDAHMRLKLRLKRLSSLLQDWTRPFYVRGAIVLLLAGALGSLSLAPLKWWWMLPVSFVPLVHALMTAAQTGLHARRRLTAGAWGLGLYGLGWFGASVWWVGEAFLVEAETFAAIMPLAILFMALLLAAFWALAGLLFAWLAVESGAPMTAALLASTWLLADVFRGCCIFGGFPWNLPAHGLAGLSGMEQMVALVGVEGLSWLAVFLAATPGLLLMPGLRGKRLLAGLAGSLLVLTTGWGQWRLLSHPPTDSAVQVRIVQPAIPQREKWKPENRSPIFRRLLALSSQPPSAGQPLPDVIVWPESAVPFLLEEAPAALLAIARMLQPGQVLITGALRRAAPSGPDARRLKNSILVIDDAGRIIGTYDKRHLVPFGEYLPAAFILEPLGLRKLVPLPRGFRRGAADPPLLPVGKGGQALGLVCYEAIFPLQRRAARSRAHAGRAADRLWLVNVTNDAWFGSSIGPHQHLDAARLRAIEVGLPLIRAANTGISAVFDPLGRERGRLPLIRPGILDLSIPLSIDMGLTSLYGCIIVLLFAATLVVLQLFHNFRAV